MEFDLSNLISKTTKDIPYKKKLIGSEVGPSRMKRMQIPTIPLIIDTKLPIASSPASAAWV